MKAARSNKSADEEFKAISDALNRAAIRAREIAIQTRTPLVYVKDGKLVSKIPTRRSALIKR